MTYLRSTAPPLASLSAWLLLAMLAGGCSSHAKQSSPAPDALKRFEFTEPKWGSVFRIILYAPDDSIANRAAGAAWSRIDEIGRATNDYDPQSEVSRLSRMTDAGPMAEPVAVSRDLYIAIEASIEASKQSDGEFDCTVGPMVKLWRRSRDLGQVPTPERIAKAKASVGYRLIKLVPDGSKVQLLAPQMRIDLGGIVTGYATAEVLRVLREQHVPRALIDAAGDLAASDPLPGEVGWRVAIQAIEDPMKPAGYVRIANRAISTSGDTYRYVEIDGVRYSHIVDPKTGLGLTRRVGVTVIADDGLTADWLDTALPLMELPKALDLVERIPDAAARITTIAPDGGIKVYESARFARFSDGSVSASAPAATMPSLPEHN